jgi:hypothetical protein
MEAATNPSSTSAVVEGLAAAAAGSVDGFVLAAHVQAKAAMRVPWGRKRTGIVLKGVRLSGAFVASYGDG